MDNEQGWTRLAKAVRRRRDERGWTQLDVATRGVLSIDRIQAIEGARTDRYSSRTLTKLERGLEWETGSCRAILDGGEPTPYEAERPAVPQPIPRKPTIEQLAARLAEMDERIAEMEQEIREQREQLENRDQAEPGQTEAPQPGRRRGVS